MKLNGRQIESLYLGGCLFEPNADAEYTILATFDELPDKPAAVVYGQYGKGDWLLSSTHPEYNKEAIELLIFNVKGNEYQDFRALQPSQHLNLDMLDELLNKLLT
ncbi:TPA: hypothetical protein KDY48_004313 [Vibrio parahaemolyticus]|nr:hypothetical protein [Vibrio parahaemolyticus]HBC3383589.1 hypothetical protein [Vibrio parahaemolyticus]HBC3445579.1 hypothetical protein [Vibrio parahaemolyticus]HBC3845397.1 hypothetical protein [Vibrio parahaemolyticus]HBH7861976.1 hypothetical protein [Vibrio parahaemolyticus]